MSRMNFLFALATGVSVVALTQAALLTSAMAQTVRVVGAPEGQAPAPVGNTALTGTTALGTTGRLIFNHTDNSNSGYAVTTAVGGSAGSRIDLLAGTTTFTQAAPIRRPATGSTSTITYTGEESVNSNPLTGGFAGNVTIRSGATLQLAQYFTLRTTQTGTRPNYVKSVSEADYYTGMMFTGGLTVEKGGRLTGQGAFGSGVDDVIFNGIVSPHGFTDRTSRFDGPNGRFDVGNSSPAAGTFQSNTLRFGKNSIYEVDVNLALPDGPLAADLIVSQLNTVIEEGAQLRVRVTKPVGPTTYLVGRRINILQLASASVQDGAHLFSQVFEAGVPSPAQSVLYIDLGEIAQPATGTRITRNVAGTDGVVRTYTFQYVSTNRSAKKELSGNFTLTADSETQLTQYLALKLGSDTTAVYSFRPGAPTSYIRSYMFLEIVQNRFFNEDANTANGIVAANALQAIGDHNPLYTRLMNLPTDSAAIPKLGQFFNALSGDLHVGVRGLLAQDAYSMQRALSRRLSNYEPGGAHLWAEMLGGQRQFDANNEAPELKEDGYGLLAGIDTTLTGAWRVGLTGGYRKVDVDGPDAFTGKAEINQFYGSVYTSGVFGKIRAQAGAGLSKASVETERSVVLVDVVDNLLGGTYDGTVVNAFGELSYVHALKAIEIEPFIGYNFVRADTDPVRETELRGQDAQAALLISGDQTEVQFATLGAKARTVSVGPVAFDGLLGWRRGFGDLELQGQHLMNNREYLKVTGSNLSENAAVVSVGARWKVTDKVTLDAVYDGIIGDEGQDHTARIGVAWRF